MTFINIDFTIRQFHSKQLQTSLFGKSVRIVVLLVVFLLGLFLAACSSTSKPPTIETAEEVSTFRLELSEESLIVAQGDSGQIAITMQGMKSLDDLELYVEDLPEELLDSTSLSTDGQGIFSVEASAEAVLSNYDLTLVAMVKGKESRANLRVEVVPTGQPSSKVSQLLTQATGEIPVISPIRNQSVIRNTNNPRTIKVNVRVTDPDNNSFRLKVNSRKRAVIPNQPWKSCNSPCRVNLTPVPDKTEKVRVTVVVRDPDGNRVSRSFRVNVVPRYVRNTSDSGSQSLRYIILEAAAGDVIGFHPSVFSTTQTIVLENRITFNKDLIIEGTGIDNLTISGNNIVQHFDIIGANVGLQDMKLINGYSQNYGGSMRVYKGSNRPAPQLTLKRVTVRDNEATQGGGIYLSTDSSLVVRNSLITNNKAQKQGGGIYSRGDLVRIIAGSTISNNEAKGQGGGIASTFGTVMLENCVLANNVVARLYDSYLNTSGGGVYSEGDLNIKNCQITENTAEGHETHTRGGGITNLGNLFVENSTIEANSVHSLRNCANPFICPDGPNGQYLNFYHYGAGIYNGGVAILASGADVIANEPVTYSVLPTFYFGGGIYNAGTFTLQSGSRVNLNATNDDGGGIYNTGILTLDTGSEVKNNDCYSSSCGRNIANFGTLTNNGDTNDGDPNSIYPPAP